MNILIIGEGKGSYLVRGRQLGGAMGARVVTEPTVDDLRWASVIVLIKRAGLQWVRDVRRAGKPIVWDALDFWAQPEQNGLSEADSRALLQEWLRIIKPALVIGATEAMATAAGGVFLPHHSWPGLTPSPARPDVKTVGYQGSKKYLGRWFKAVQAECDQRGWQFVINPPDLRACDLLVAFRDGKWDGWMCREWKSGVKMVNALAAGRPIITQESVPEREAWYCGSTITAPEYLSDVLGAWTSLEARQRAVAASEAWYRAFTLEAVAARYRTILQGVLKAKAA